MFLFFVSFLVDCTTTSKLTVLQNKSKHKRKKLIFTGEELYPVCEAFAERLSGSKNCRDFTVQDLVSDSMTISTLSCYSYIIPLKCPVSQSQLLDKTDKTGSQRSPSASKPGKTRSDMISQRKPSEVLVVLLERLNQEAPVLKASSATLYMNCLKLVRDMDDQLEGKTRAEDLIRISESLGMKARGDGRQFTGAKSGPVLVGAYEGLPIVREVIVKWLKKNGGNGAVSFPRPSTGQLGS